jgi:hypothetical protein
MASANFNCGGFPGQGCFLCLERGRNNDAGISRNVIARLDLNEVIGNEIASGSIPARKTRATDTSSFWSAANDRSPWRHHNLPAR